MATVDEMEARQNKSFHGLNSWLTNKVKHSLRVFFAAAVNVMEQKDRTVADSEKKCWREKKHSQTETWQSAANLPHLGLIIHLTLFIKLIQSSQQIWSPLFQTAQLLQNQQGNHLLQVRTFSSDEIIPMSKKGFKNKYVCVEVLCGLLPKSYSGLNWSHVSFKEISELMDP